MYYLLEDNRIVKDYSVTYDCGKLKVLAEDTEDKGYVNIYEIKKQSENVFDLIEKGDLVNTIVDSIYQVVIIEKNTIIAPQWAFDLAVINAIYKPNSKGNYIKVWEKKNG